MTSSDDHRHACLHRHAAPEGFALPGAERHYPPDLELEPLHLDIALALDLDLRTAAGEVTHTLAARRGGSPVLRLHAVAFEDVAVSDADDRAVSSTYDGELLVVRWKKEWTAGEERRLVVRYRVRDPITGLTFSKPLPGHPAEPWFAATDNETERARYWLPCIDLPSARPRLDFHLRTRERFTILANGALLSEEKHGDGTKTAHWRLASRCPSYLTCFAVGDFTRQDDGEHVGADGAGVPVAYFSSREFSGKDLLRTFDRTRPMLAWMTKKLDYPFPFPKYFQFALPRFGGAMENISLVSWDDRFMLDEALAGEWSRLIDQINVHEMGHSYFGDLVVIRDFAHAWLKESWATYLEQCWFEDEVSEDEGRYEHYMNAMAYFDEADARYQRPIVLREYSSSFDLYDRHLYPGGACRLHTLRHELGDGVFWAGVRAYLRRYANEVVETDDFRRTLEEVSGRSLGRFFDQWFHSPGYPRLKISFTFDVEREEGSFEIEQKQVDPKAGVPVFDLPLDIAWHDGDGWKTQALRLTKEKQVVVVKMERDPQMVRVDPGQKILHRQELNPGDEKLCRALTRAPDVVGRIEAGLALCQTGKRRNVLAVANAYAKETFWGVRVEWARALSRAGSEAALGSLAVIVAAEREPMVLEPLLRTAGRHRHAGLRAAIEARVKKGLPPRALGAAYEALGAQRDDAPYSLLEKASRKEGFQGFAQAGALWGLAATRREEALRPLLHATRPKVVSDRARPGAVAALGELGRMGERRVRERAVERAVDLLRDPINRVRDAAVGALEGMAASEASSALESYGRGLSRQHEVRALRALQHIRKTAAPREKAHEKHFDEVKERLRKAEDSIERLEARLAGKKKSKTKPKAPRRTRAKKKRRGA